MEISVGRVNRLMQAIVLGEDAEALCESPEELQILPQLREQCQFKEGMILSFESDSADANPWDCAGFDRDAWEEAGMPEDAWAFVKPYVSEAWA